MSDVIGLVGDIGGTHARFALVRETGGRLELSDHVKLRNAEQAGPREAMAAYLDQIGAGRPGGVVLAVAGPVRDGRADLTNRDWTFAVDDLLAQGFATAGLINDFEALALAAPLLPADGLKTVGPDRAGLAGAPLLVAGPGTGFGASLCVPDEDGWRVAPTEAGHIGFAPVDDVEVELWRRLSSDGRVSVEDIVSGPGLVRLHGALTAIDGAVAPDLQPHEIMEAALADLDGAEGRTVRRFCALLGSALGDIALATGARAGVYMAGGVAQRLEPVLERTDFRARFEAKEPMRDYVSDIPTRLITWPYAAQLGAAVALQRLVRRKA